ncbi:hypothetical protein C8J55DRAFT_556386 [Lentinula edodes]|uniref:Uncharacterized protein n=1 Tax=Lentinula lateritia TaxID=40482 RepID=A0A9W9AYL5_9AGAR|nr:hypothetical protein C8J55DRAFT_556386 [Lentinula edodes]
MSQSQTDFPKDQTIDPNSTVQTEGEYDLEPLKFLDIGHGIICKHLPDLPYWGDFGEVSSEFYTENDFEIIAIAYCAQVEHFLTQLVDVHDFKTNELRNNSELTEEHIMLFEEIVEAANQDIPLPMESISNAVHHHRTKRVTSTKVATANSYLGIGSSWITSLPPRSTCRLQDVFPVFNFGNNVAEAPDPGDDSSSNEDNSKDERPSRSSPRLKCQIPVATSIGAGWSKEQFDMRLKQDTVPTWDGDTNTIVRWIKRVNNLAKKSQKLCKQLGSVVPRQLEGSAQYWYYSLPLSHRDHLETDWKLLRDEIAAYYMNCCWMEAM